MPQYGSQHSSSDVQHNRFLTCKTTDVRFGHDPLICNHDTLHPSYRHTGAWTLEDRQRVRSFHSVRGVEQVNRTVFVEFANNAVVYYVLDFDAHHLWFMQRHDSLHVL